MKCYLCDSEATSTEHIPPKSFFPANKRINLMTVPSCNVHNENTHLDDEYVRNLVALTDGNNQVAVDHFKDKAFRSLMNSPKLAAAISRNPQHINLIKGDDSKKNLAFQVDMPRFDRVLKKIAYGIYFHKFGKTWKKLLDISKLNFITDDGDYDPIANYIRNNRALYPTIFFEGTNPDVFKYCIAKEIESQERIIIMKFYDNFEVWAVPKLISNYSSIEE